MLFLFTLLAQTSPSPSTTGRGSGGAGQLLFFGLIIAAMYFLMIRPQRTRARAQQEMSRSIEVGDEVETVAGMFGRVRRATDDVVWVELIPGQEPVKMARGAIRRRVIEPDAGPTP